MGHFSRHDIERASFERLLARERVKLLKAVDKALEPYFEQGRQALAEFVEGEERLQSETFSRN